jgi:hypothetical protein
MSPLIEGIGNGEEGRVVNSLVELAQPAKEGPAGSIYLSTAWLANRQAFDTRWRQRVETVRSRFVFRIFFFFLPGHRRAGRERESVSEMSLDKFFGEP